MRTGFDGSQAKDLRGLKPVGPKAGRGGRALTQKNNYRSPGTRKGPGRAGESLWTTRTKGKGFRTSNWHQGPARRGPTGTADWRPRLFARTALNGQKTRTSRETPGVMLDRRIPLADFKKSAGRQAWRREATASGGGSLSTIIWAGQQHACDRNWVLPTYSRAEPLFRAGPVKRSGQQGSSSASGHSSAEPSRLGGLRRVMGPVLPPRRPRRSAGPPPPLTRQKGGGYVLGAETFQEKSFPHSTSEDKLPLPRLSRRPIG